MLINLRIYTFMWNKEDCFTFAITADDNRQMQDVNMVAEIWKNKSESIFYFYFLTKTFSKSVEVFDIFLEKYCVRIWLLISEFTLSCGKRKTGFSFVITVDDNREMQDISMATEIWKK